MSPADKAIESSRATVGRRWRPLSLVHVFETGYLGFMLVCLWIGLTGLSVWWPYADYGPPGFTWNHLILHIAGTEVDYGFYLPWVVCVCLVMWLGFEWAVVPAYLATLFSTVHKGMPADLAVVNALHNPLAMAVFLLFYGNFKSDYSLRSLRAWLWFIGASLLASIVSSIGGFISEFTGTPIGESDFLGIWLGWWPNAFAQSLLINAPLIFFLSPAVERLKQRHYARAQTQPFSQQELLLAACMFALMLVLFLLAGDQWAVGRMEALLKLSLPDAARFAIHAQFSLQRYMMWTLALLLAAISLGGVFFTSRWVGRMRARFDSENRETRDALRRSEANFRNFFENSPAPMFLYDRDNWAIVDVNRAAAERYGYSREEFLRMTAFDIRPQEDVARLKEFIREMTDSNTEYRQVGEWRHLTKSGEIMDVDVRMSTLNMDERRLNLVLVHDISPRKQAQAATERRARELQKLAASSLQISGVKAVEQVLQIAADRARELCSARLAVCQCWSGERGTTTRMRSSLAEEYAAFQGFKAAPDGSGIYKLLVEKQYPIRLSAGELEEHPAFRRFGAYRERHPPLKGLLAVPLTSSQAEVVGALMVSHKVDAEFDAEDEALLVQLAQITSAGLENVRLSEALIQHMEELEQRVSERTEELDASNKELDAFAYSVAHDLRAPLRAMHGFADAVLEDFGAKLDATGRDYLDRIIKGAKNMDTLIQDLLAYSRVGRSNTPLEGVDLETVLREVINDLGHDIETRGAEVRLDVPPLTVLAHKVTLKQVFVNLVSNALKFVAPGETPQVRISATARAGVVEVRVQDNGIGIAPEHRERIFNVFERLHGAETYPGTGIGLSIVKKGLVRMHGDITVESDASGSTFRARLKEYRNG